MERKCPACSTIVQDDQLTDCPTCGASLSMGASADDDLFEDLGDFGDIGTNDFIPLPGQASDSDADGEMDLDDLFGDEDDGAHDGNAQGSRQ